MTLLIRVAENVFVIDKEIDFMGMMNIPVRATILLTKNHVVIYSPLDAPHAYAELNSMLNGRRVVIVAPNGMHHLFVEKCKQQFPDATVLCSPSLKQRFPDRPLLGTPIGDVHGAPLLADCDEVLAWLIPCEGTLNEIVLLHKPSGSLIVSDWAFNFSEATVSKMPLKARIYAYFALRRSCSISEPFKFMIKNPHAVYRTFESICFHEWDTIIMSHGDIIAFGGKQKFRNGTIEFLREMTTSSTSSSTLWLLLGSATVLTIFSIASVACLSTLMTNKPDS